MSDKYPACHCADYYPDASPTHPPDCPVRQEIDHLTRDLSDALAVVAEYSDALQAIAATLGMPATGAPDGDAIAQGVRSAIDHWQHMLSWAPRAAMDCDAACRTAVQAYADRALDADAAADAG